jgi:hypothetical protein
MGASYLHERLTGFCIASGASAGGASWAWAWAWESIGGGASEAMMGDVVVVVVVGWMAVPGGSRVVWLRSGHGLGDCWEHGLWEHHVDLPRFCFRLHACRLSIPFLSSILNSLLSTAPNHYLLLQSRQSLNAQSSDGPEGIAYTVRP